MVNSHNNNDFTINNIGNTVVAVDSFTSIWDIRILNQSPGMRKLQESFCNCD